MQRCIYLNPFLWYTYHLLFGKYSKLTFYERMQEFAQKYVTKFEQGNHKYEQFASMMPLKKLPPARAFLNIPLYSQNLRDKWLPLLNDA